MRNKRKVTKKSSDKKTVKTISTTWFLCDIIRFCKVDTFYRKSLTSRETAKKSDRLSQRNHDMLLNDINSTFASALDIAMYIMVLILEGNSEHVHTNKNRPLLILIFRFVAALVLNKCLTQIK